MKEQHALQHYVANERGFVKACLALKHDVLQNGGPKVTNFLTLREQKILRSIVGSEAKLIFYGGIEGSERQLAIISERGNAHCQNNVAILLIEYNKKFGVLRHQDVLGAILGLGLERKVIGDIVLEAHDIFVAVRQTIAQYLQEQLTQVGKQAVKVRIYTERVIKEKEKYKEKTIYVNSLRLDSLISHVLPCNREEAKTCIAKEFVQINGVSTTNCKLSYAIGDIISIRKFGRIYIDNILKTRRNRFKMEVRIT